MPRRGGNIRCGRDRTAAERASLGRAQAQQGVVLAADVPTVARAAARGRGAGGGTDSADRDLRRMSGSLALTWFEHRRTKELCAGLGIELVVLASALRGPLRYLVLGGRTLALLARRRPRILLVQNPSLILAALAAAVRGVLGYRLIADAHNEAVVPFINRQWWVTRLSRWVIRRADLDRKSTRLNSSHTVISYAV